MSSICCDFRSRRGLLSKLMTTIIVVVIKEVCSFFKSQNLRRERGWVNELSK